MFKVMFLILAIMASQAFALPIWEIQSLKKPTDQASAPLKNIKDATLILIRSYLSTCRKQGLSPMEALQILFGDKLPEFMTI